MQGSAVYKTEKVESYLKFLNLKRDYELKNQRVNKPSFNEVSKCPLPAFKYSILILFPRLTIS